MFGLDSKGFKRKRYDDIYEEMAERSRQEYGDQVNLSERSPLGIFFRIVAWVASLLWQLAENVYFSAYIRTAEGVNLDRVAQYIAAVRRDKTKSTGQVEITGDAGTVVPANFIVGTKSGINFQTKAYVVLDANGKGIADIEAIEAGASGNVPPNNITEIINPIAGVSSVTNPTATKDGRDVESDAELRERYDASIAKGGASTIDSIRATLLDLPGVYSAFVEENDTMNTVNGLPPKCVAAYVYGGQDEDIAKAIFATKAGGIQAFGTTIVTVYDLAGNPHQVGYTRVTEVPIYLRVTLQRNDEYPVDGDKRVEVALIQYIGGQDEDAQEYSGLDVEEDVVYNKLIHAALQVPGIDDVTIEVSTDGVNYAELQNVTIDQKQIARTDWQKIEVL